LDKKKTLVICSTILLAGAILTTITFFTEPTATRIAATRKSAMLVDVIEVHKANHRPDILAMGTVEASQDITLSPRVGGEIVSRSQAFTPGGYGEKGDVLLRIDPADYRNTLQQRKSELRQTIADLNVEMGRQNVARQDYQLLDETLSPELESLVLRKPQLSAARAVVEVARAAVKQAELELERTNIRAPFDAHILSRKANVGSQVSPGDDLGRLVGRETYWVVATVPLSKLQWLAFPKTADETGSEVQIRNRSSWPEGVYRTGYLFRLVGALEERTRMARVLISVPDPLSYKPESADLPPLMIGAFVETRIEAGEIADVVRLNRDYIRANNTVWVMEDDKLSVRPVEIVLQDATDAYISKGLNHLERVVTTNLSTPRDGASLRVKGSGGEQVESGENAQ
jgi:RND family efflux transporter MFP subunit